MQSRAFSLISVAVSTLLLAALVFVIVLAIRDNPAIALRTLATLTPSTPRVSSGGASGAASADNQTIREEVSPSAETPTPSGAQAAPQLDQQARRVESAGFAFRPLVGYSLDEANGSVTMQARGDGGSSAGPGAVFVLSGGAPDQFVSGATSDLDATFDRFVQVYAERDKFEVGGRSRIILDGAPGLAVDLRGDPAINPFAGKIAMVEPRPNRIFLMIGVAPAEEWDAQVATAFASVLASVTFFDEPAQPVAALPTATRSEGISPTATAMPAATETTVPPTQEVPTEEVQLATATPTPEATATATEPAPARATEEVTATPEDTATPEPIPPMPTAQATGSATARGALGGVLGGNALGGGTATPSVAGTPEAEATEAQADATPTRGPEVRRRVYTNGNYGYDVSIMRSTLWSATGGGVIAWNKSSGSYVKFTTLDGLATNHLVAAAACPLPGFGVIFGTDQGLQIFDTQNGSWKVFTSENSPMSDDNIVDVYCEPAYNFLVVAYAHNGLDIYDADTGEWTHVDREDGLEADNIRDIAVVGDRQSIWVASSAGAAVYGRSEAVLYTPENSPLDSSDILALAGDGSETVWLSTGETLYRSNGRDWSRYSAETSEDFPQSTITAIGVASDGTVWIGSESGEVCAFDPVRETCDALYHNEEGMVQGPITSINIGSEGDVYYTTAGAGIGMLLEGEWRSLVLPSEPLPGNRVAGIAQAPDDVADAYRSGAIWIATDGGIASIREDGNQVLASLTPGANAVAIGPDGELWVGGQGVAYFDGESWTRYGVDEGLAGAEVTAIAVDTQRRTWVGTTTGLSIWTANTFVNLTTENGLPSDQISALAVADEIVWIGTSNGLLRFRDNQLRVYNTSNVDLPSNRITALAVDEDGTLLVGTDRGLARFTGDSAFAISGVPSVEITAIAAGNGRIWAATASPDLLVFDGTAWQPFAETAYLPSPRIRVLYLDRGGALWIGGETGGLVRYVP